MVKFHWCGPCSGWSLFMDHIISKVVLSCRGLHLLDFILKGPITKISPGGNFHLALSDRLTFHMMLRIKAWRFASRYVSRMRRKPRLRWWRRRIPRESSVLCFASRDLFNKLHFLLTTKMCRIYSSLFLVRGLPSMTSTEFWDFFYPLPLSVRKIYTVCPQMSFRAEWGRHMGHSFQKLNFNLGGFFLAKIVVRWTFLLRSPLMVVVPRSCASANANGSRNQPAIERKETLSRAAAIASRRGL